MASFSIKFLLPNRRRTARPQATPSQTVAPPESGSENINPDRLEPRVQKRDGYFVLKEKFRQGINPQEKVKVDKDPLKLFTENGIEELSRTPFEEIEQSKLLKDDIDFRLKWLGLFHRRKHHCESVFL